MWRKIEKEREQGRLAIKPLKCVNLAAVFLIIFLFSQLLTFVFYCLSKKCKYVEACLAFRFKFISGQPQSRSLPHAISLFRVVLIQTHIKKLMHVCQTAV